MITMKVNIEEMRSLYAAPFGVAALAYYRATQIALENFSRKLYFLMINKGNKPFKNRTHRLRKSSKRARFSVAGKSARMLNPEKGLIGSGVHYVGPVEHYVFRKRVAGEYGNSYIVGYFVEKHELVAQMKFEIDTLAAQYYAMFMNGNKYSIAQYARRGKELLNRQRVLYV